MDINKIKYLTNKSIDTCKEEGFKSFVNKTKNYIRLRVPERQKYASVKDILFINGCTLPHPSRYRVSHQMEQLEASGLSTNCVDYNILTLDMMKYYRGFVFFRCPVTPIVKEFIEKAKECNKVVFYDIDDLVIDEKYTKTIKHLKTLSKEEKALYDDGVNRMRETLLMCDYAITTTERLAKELKNYCSDVYINRNVASERMVELSLKAIKKANHDENKIIMGYLSGSITHNADFELILPVVKKLMKEHKNLYLQVVGLLDIPKSLEAYKDRILTAPFVDWQRLPDIIAGIDINLAPLEESIFNEAKSENKWVEAALCKVVTAASKVGAFEHSIKDGKTGVLCKDKDDWYNKLNKLIIDCEYRQNIANNAFNEVISNNLTTYTGQGLANYINSKLPKNIAFILPTTNISGGVNVVLKHCSILKRAGYDVSIINMDNNGDDIVNLDGNINVINSHNTNIYAYFDTMVATLWTTLEFVRSYYNVLNKSYLVQNFETNFGDYGQNMKLYANATYCTMVPINYLTISKWCQNWLKSDYNKNSKYAPNGIKLEQFPFKKRNFNEGKIKILVEGNSDDYYKNVDESFRIIDKLDKDKYEIHFLSYQGKPKDWYYVDNFMHRVPYDKVGEVYGSCDILIKSSILESFSYPPLEMMATGGIVVVAPNEGNIEYLKDGENCLFYKPGNIDDAVKKIEKIRKDEKLREKLIENGLKTAKEREWKKLEKDILNLYE